MLITMSVNIFVALYAGSMVKLSFLITVLLFRSYISFMQIPDELRSCVSVAHDSV